MRTRTLLAVAVGIAAAVACGDMEETELPSELEAPVGPHDVSVLFPIPEVLGQRTSMIGADATGLRGQLLPQDVYVALPLVDVVLSNEKSYPLLRLISARFDPCFPGLGAPCQSQIRLVMQPVIIDPAGEHLIANDAAVHLFYALERDELEAAMRRAVDLREASGFAVSAEPLGVHPALAAEGVEGAFARGFRDLLLTHCGEENLVRVTFMALEGVSDDWRFGGFDRVDGELVPLAIPGLTSTDQSFLNVDRSGVSFDGATVSPASTSSDDFSLLIDPPAALAAPVAERQAAFDALLRVESPTRHSPETIDCVTCHLAASTRAFAVRELAVTAAGSPDRFVDASGSEPAGKTAFGTNVLRAFGAFGRNPAIAQRTVNETAAVVAYVNREMVGK